MKLERVELALSPGSQTHNPHSGYRASGFPLPPASPALLCTLGSEVLTQRGQLGLLESWFPYLYLQIQMGCGLDAFEL